MRTYSSLLHQLFVFKISQPNPVVIVRRKWKRFSKALPVINIEEDRFKCTVSIRIVWCSLTKVYIVLSCTCNSPLNHQCWCSLRAIRGEVWFWKWLRWRRRSKWCWVLTRWLLWKFFLIASRHSSLEEGTWGQFKWVCYVRIASNS